MYTSLSLSPHIYINGCVYYIDNIMIIYIYLSTHQCSISGCIALRHASLARQNDTTVAHCLACKGSVRKHKANKSQTFKVPRL